MATKFIELDVVGIENCENLEFAQPWRTSIYRTNRKLRLRASAVTELSEPTKDEMKRIGEPKANSIVLTQSPGAIYVLQDMAEVLRRIAEAES